MYFCCCCNVVRACYETVKYTGIGSFDSVLESQSTRYQKLFKYFKERNSVEVTRWAVRVGILHRAIFVYNKKIWSGKVVANPVEDDFSS